MNTKNILTSIILGVFVASSSCTKDKKTEPTSQELVSKKKEDKNTAANLEDEEWMKQDFWLSGTYVNKQMTYYQDGEPTKILVEFVGGTIPVNGEIVAHGYFKKNAEGSLYFEVKNTAKEVDLYQFTFIEYKENSCPIFGWKEGHFTLEDGYNFRTASKISLTDQDYIYVNSASYGTSICVSDKGKKVLPVYYITSIQ